VPTMRFRQGAGAALGVIGYPPGAVGIDIVERKKPGNVAVRATTGGADVWDLHWP